MLLFPFHSAAVAVAMFNRSGRDDRHDGLVLLIDGRVSTTTPLFSIGDFHPIPQKSLRRLEFWKNGQNRRWENRLLARRGCAPAGRNE
jgi:hypothetical protein